MGIKKVLLCVCSALAMTAFAMPAVASANRLLDVSTGQPPANGTHFEITGPIGFSSLGAGFQECIWHATTEVLNGGTTLRTVAVEITPHTCVGFGSSNFFNGCTVEEIHPYPGTLPWDIHVGAYFFYVTGAAITFRTSSNCVSREVDVTFPEITLNAGPGPITSLEAETVNGEMHFTDLGISAEEVEVFGEMEVVGADSGTYEIE